MPDAVAFHAAPLPAFLRERFSGLIADGCVIWQAAALGPQCHAGREAPDRQHFRSPSADDRRQAFGPAHQAYNKGFWTAELLADASGRPTSPHLSAMRRTLPAWVEHDGLWQLFPDPQAPVLVLDGAAALAAAQRHFADLDGGELDLAAIKRGGFAALHTTARGIQEDRDLKAGWGCASTCWLAWAFVQPPRELVAPSVAAMEAPPDPRPLAATRRCFPVRHAVFQGHWIELEADFRPEVLPDVAVLTEKAVHARRTERTASDLFQAACHVNMQILVDYRIVGHSFPNLPIGAGLYWHLWWDEYTELVPGSGITPLLYPELHLRLVGRRAVLFAALAEALTYFHAGDVCAGGLPWLSAADLSRTARELGAADDEAP